MKVIVRGGYRFLVRASKVLSRQGLYPFLDAEFSAIPPGSRVLSVGAGGEVNRRLYSEGASRGFEIVSSDIDPLRGPDVVADVCSPVFADGSFDVVVMSEVLEHVRSPHHAVDRLHACLRPGGVLLLTAPFLLPIHERPHDYFRYTHYGLRMLLSEFEEVVIRERNSWPAAVNVVAARLAVDERLSSRLAAPLFVLLAFLNLPFVLLIGRLVPTDFATTGYVVSARKRPDGAGSGVAAA